MRHERPSSNGEARSSALWGRGGREVRSSALWGRGGRSSIALLALVVSVVIPASGIASDGPDASVPAELLAAAKANPDATFNVIVQGRREEQSDRTTEEIKENGGQLKKAFRSINGAAARSPASSSSSSRTTRTSRSSRVTTGWRSRASTGVTSPT